MGLSRLHSFLRRHSRIGIDTSIFIYEVEQNPAYAELAHHVFGWLERPGHAAVTSTITLTECLVRPYREADARRVNEFYALLSTYPNLEWIAPNTQTADLAARLRAEHRLRTPDALQAATAKLAGVGGFLTNDPIFERVAAFETLVFDQLL